MQPLACCCSCSAASGRESVALVRKTFSVWGNGSATRDFVYVDDVARTIAQSITTAHRFSGDVLNIGSGSETSVRQLADLVAETVGGGIEPEVC